MAWEPDGLEASGATHLGPTTVRISLTDRCDLACFYCRPSRCDGYLPRRLGRAAWRALAEALLRTGVRRVRLTGGEPLLHPGVVDVVGDLAGLGVGDLALTTNGTRLGRLAAPLLAAGLARVTVSLDTLDPARFARITGGGRLADVRSGIETALAAGFSELKLNIVIIRDQNDDEVEDLVRWAWARRIVPRFIELMRIGGGARLPDRATVPASELQARLAPLLADGPPRRDPGRGPAVYAQARHDPGLRVGFISGASRPFCGDCDRLRVTADGTLRPCLATGEGVAAGGLAEAGDVDGLVEAIQAAWAKKPDGLTFRGCADPGAARLSIRAVGG